MLAARGSEQDASIADRRARHLLAAGKPAEALKPLLAAAESHVLLGEYTEAHGLLDLWHTAMSSLTEDKDDPRQVEGLLVRAETYRRCWELESCEASATRALEVANKHNLYRSRAEALFILGHVSRLGRDFVTAERRIFEALGIFEVLDEFRGKARALRAAAVIARERSQFRRAIDSYEKAMNLFWTLNEEGEVADCVCGLGHVYRTQQKYEKARSHYTEAREIALRIGNPHQAAEYTNGLGEIARYRGELDEAERLYRAAYNTMSRIGSKDAIVPQLNLSLTLLLRRKFEAAHDELAAALPTVENLAFRAWTLVHLLPCLAHLSRFSEFDRTLRAARKALAESALHDVDIAEAAELCGDVLKIRGERDRAIEAFTLAAAQWDELGNQERRDRALDRLVRLQEPS
jgi:tetratricopeptide (TPR) repeat protein